MEIHLLTHWLQSFYKIINTRTFTGDTQMTPIIVESDAWTTGQPTVLNVLPEIVADSFFKWANWRFEFLKAKWISVK